MNCCPGKVPDFGISHKLQRASSNETLNNALAVSRATGQAVMPCFGKEGAWPVIRGSQAWRSCNTHTFAGMDIGDALQVRIIYKG